MGFFTSGTAKERFGGMLTGGKINPTVKAKLPKLTPTKSFKIPVPRDCVAGDEFRAELDGVETILKVPPNFSHTKGARITHTVRGDDDFVITSTLPTVPGHEIVLSMPVVYGCVTAPDLEVQELVQQAQDQLTSLAIASNCNAVLGIHFSVTVDDTMKTPVVFAFGTPCVLLDESTGRAPTSSVRGAGDPVATTTLSDDEGAATVKSSKNLKKSLKKYEEVKEPEYDSDDENESSEDMGVLM